jgi:SAM-dependent methyltransferase
MNVPFDPIASKLAQQIGLTLVVLRGDNLQNLEKLFAGKKFIGTVVAPTTVGATFFDREYFDGGKGEYHGYTTKLYSRIFSYLANIYRALCIRIFLSPRKVLDVGCGTGRMIYLLRQLGVDARGIDISHYAISRAGVETQPFISHGDITKLPFPDKSFDLVTTFDVLEHIPTDKLEKAISECNRVSRTYIMHKLYAIENTWIRKLHGSDLSHVSVYGCDWWRDFWKTHNYKKVNILYPKLPLWMETLFVLERK